MNKILVPFKTSELGGSQLFFLRLFDHIDQEKFSFSVWLFQKGHLEKELKKRHIPYNLFPASYLRTPWGLFFLTKNLLKASPDLIYLHSSRLIALIAKLVEIPCLERINMSRNKSAGGWSRYAFIDFLFSNLNTQILAVSEAIKTQLVARGIKEKKVKVIKNFVDLEQFKKPLDRKAIRQRLKISENAFVILNVGRLVPQKSQSDFLKIAHRLLKKRENLHFILVGDGPLEDSLHQEAKALDLFDRLTILPFQNTIEDIYSVSNLLLHTARWEPLANVLLEAMAAGLPLVASDVDGSREVVHEKFGDYLYACDDFEAATEHILSVIDQFHSPRKKLIALRDQWLEESFSIQQVIKKYEKLFSDLLSKNKQ